MDDDNKVRINKILSSPGSIYFSELRFYHDAPTGNYDNILDILKGILKEDALLDRDEEFLSKIEYLLEKMNPRRTWLKFIAPGEITSRWFEVDTLFVTNEQADSYSEQRDRDVLDGSDERIPIEFDTGQLL